MMKRILLKTLLLAFVASVLVSCKKDDEVVTVPLRDRGEEAVAAQIEIETFLSTHFYNYEEFQAPPENFDFKIKFDTIAGDNSEKIALSTQVVSKNVFDRRDSNVQYKLYYLIVNQGGGVKPQFPDVVFTRYETLVLESLEKTDEANNPVRFDLTQVINGFQDALVEFNTAENSVINADGTISYSNFGVGAVFIPSGLGYFQQALAGIPSYSQLILTFNSLSTIKFDHDSDGVPSVIEDVNEDGFEENDDTDGDGAPNYIDTDDDGDGRLTRDEIIININGTITYPDVDNDGIPDYLDGDS